MTVRLKIRVKRADGARPYENPVYSPNGKLRPLFASIDGKAVHHPEGVYYLRYLKAGKRVWARVGNDPQLALTAKLKVEHRLQSIALGLEAPESPSPALQKTNLPDAVAEYLSDTASGKMNKTYLAYSHTLKTFLQVCSKQYVEEVNRRDILNFMALLRDAGNVPRTVSNYCNFLKTFFNQAKVPWPLLKTDRVKYTEKVISSYSEEQILTLLAAANPEESMLIQFFLYTGGRDQDVQAATFSDIDFSACTFAVTEKLDLNYTPKDKEESLIPIPDSLLKLLREHRQHHPKDRLIFPSPVTSLKKRGAN